MASNPATHLFTETEIIFRKNIIYLREKKGMTRYTFSRLEKLNMAYYYKLEDLEKPVNITFECMELLAGIHNIPVWKLFTKLYEEESETKLKQESKTENETKPEEGTIWEKSIWKRK